MSSKQTIVRVYMIYVLILVFAFAVLVKISFIQFLDGGELVEQADKQIYKTRIVKAPRGNVFADNDLIFSKVEIGILGLFSLMRRRSLFM